LKATGQVADARNLSVRDHVAIVVSTITAGGGDFNQVTLSVAIGSRQRRENRREICFRMSENFKKPKFVVGHWDSKIIKSVKLSICWIAINAIIYYLLYFLMYLSGKVDDRIAILISGFQQIESPKFLGVPIIPNSTGSSQHEAVVMLLGKWGVFNELNCASL
jgi:hypothetical protein